MPNTPDVFTPSTTIAPFQIGLQSTTAPIQGMMDRAKVNYQMGLTNLQGAETQQIEQNLAQRTIDQQSLQGVDWSDPKSLREGAGKLAAGGNLKGAAELSQQGGLIQQRQTEENDRMMQIGYKAMSAEDATDADRVWGHNLLAAGAKKAGYGDMPVATEWTSELTEKTKKAQEILNGPGTAQEKEDGLMNLYIGTRGKRAKEELKGAIDLIDKRKARAETREDRSLARQDRKQMHEDSMELRRAMQEKKSGLTAGTLKNEGMKYLATGKISMSFGGKEDREAIMNTTSQIMAENGLSEADVLAIQAAYEADAKSLNNLQKRASMTSQATGQAHNNAAALLKASENFQRSDYPGPNRIIGWFTQNLGSRETQANFGKFKVSLNAWAREYMRVTTRAAMSVAELTQGAQEKVDKMLSTSDSWSTLKAKIEQGDVEMMNTTKSHNDELMKTKTRLNNPLEYVKAIKGEGAGEGAGGGVHEGQTATNQKTGEKVIFKGGKWQPMK